MTNKCKCGRFVSAAEGAKCKKCSSVFHKDCVKLSPNNPISSKWVCEPCHKAKEKSASNKTLSTPAQKVASHMPNSSTVCPAVVPEVVNAALQAGDPSSCIVAELRLLRSEMISFRKEIAQLNVTLSDFNSRVDNIESRLTRLEEQAATREAIELDSVQATICQLQSQINDRDQDLLMNDVEISGLQESSGENLMSLTSLLAKKLGVELDDRDIVSAERLGLRRVPTPGGSGAATDARPRPVVVRLARRSVRDELLRAARVRRGADSSGIVSDAPPRRFYVNERLTRTNRQLFHKAREEGRSKSWRFIWTKGGHIYARKTNTASVRKIRSENDIVKYITNDTNDSF